MVLVLVIGDLHIPTLTHDLPAKFKKLLVSVLTRLVRPRGAIPRHRVGITGCTLRSHSYALEDKEQWQLARDLRADTQVPGKIGQILCTGNVCDKETYDYLRTIAPEVHIVRGEFDEVSCGAGRSRTCWLSLRSTLFELSVVSLATAVL